MKNTLIKSTIILTIGGLISKIIGMITKIALTRSITTTGLGIYMLILPTFNLFITLCNLGFPTAISKLVSEEKIRSKKIILSIIPFIIIFNLLLMTIILLFAPIISNNLLKNNQTLYPLMAIGLTLPFISISSILRGYFFGKEKMLPHIVSIIIEQLIRLFLTIYFIPCLMHNSLTSAITGVVLINIVSEFTSIIILLIFLPRKIIIKKEDFYLNNQILKEMLYISIPTISSRLIGSFSYFLEPIILTSTLLSQGYNNNYITDNYGIINGYVFPLILLPSFFTLAIANSLLPIISRLYTNKNYPLAKKRTMQAILFSLLIGIPSTIIIMLFPENLLNLIYNTTKGANYVKIIAPLFIIYYLQAPLTSCLQAIGKANIAMQGTLIGAIIRLFLLFLATRLTNGMTGLIIATITNIFIVTIHHWFYVNKYLKKKA